MRVKKNNKKKPTQMRLKGISGIPVLPTEIERKIAEGIASGMKKIEALIAAGISPANARSNSKELCDKPGVRAALAETLKRANVDTERIARVIDEGLNATRIQQASIIVMGEDGKRELPVVDGYIDTTDAAIQKEFITVPDFAVRHKYLETACKLLDLNPTEKEPGAGNGIGVSADEEARMIAQAEQSAAGRDTSRYTTVVIRER